MLACANDRSRCEPIAMPHEFLSIGEAVVLADVRKKEDTVRKDIETGVMPRVHIVRCSKDARLAFTWNYVFTLAAVYGNDSLGKDLRRVALDRVYRATMDSMVSQLFLTYYSAISDAYSNTYS